MAERWNLFFFFFFFTLVVLVDKLRLCKRKELESELLFLKQVLDKCTLPNPLTYM